MHAHEVHAHKVCAHEPHPHEAARVITEGEKEDGKVESAQSYPLQGDTSCKSWQKIFLALKFRDHLGWLPGQQPLKFRGQAPE